MRKALTVLAALVLLGIGAAIGGAGHSTSTVYRTHTVYQTRTIDKAPVACTTALDTAGNVVGQLSAGYGDIGNYFEGKESQQTLVNQINSISSQVKTETPTEAALVKACERQ